MLTWANLIYNPPIDLDIVTVARRYKQGIEKLNVAAEIINPVTKLNSASRPFQTLKLNSMTSEI